MKKLYYILISLILSYAGIEAQEVEDGYTKFYYPNGQVSSEGLIRDGKPDGYWKTYYTTGVLKSEGLRTNFFLDSTWTFYNSTGEVIQKINYKYGKKNGYSLSYSYESSPDGVLISKILYVNDKKEGNAFYYHENGQLKEELNYKDNKKEGTAKVYNQEGKLVSLLEYRNDYLISRERINRTDAEGLKQGSWITYYENGRVHKEMFYKDNKLDGLYKEYKQDGSLALILDYDEGKIVEDEEDILTSQQIDLKREFDDNGNMTFQGSYREEVPVGIHRFYDQEGNVINAIIYNQEGVKVSEGIVDETGSKEGNWKDFYFSGELRAEGNYRNNRRSGKWVFYYKNGNKEQEGTYLRGLPDGLWTWYYENGNLLREESYFNGREDGESIEYDINGIIVTKGSYLNGEKEGEWMYRVGDNYEKGSYDTGLKTGTWYSYYPNEELRFEGEYIQGQANGRHKYYYPDGSLKEERYYEMGIRERNWKKYDELGNLTMTITYQNNVEYRINGQKINLPKGSIRIIK